MDSESLKGHLDLLLLAALRTEPGYGWQILGRVKEMSGGEFDLSEGTIYPALHRLDNKGLLKSSRQLVDGRQRRTYRITAKGERAFAGKREAWQAFADGMTRAIEASG